MTAEHGISHDDDVEAALTRQAWQEAGAEVRHECWIGILQKCSDLDRYWRICSVGKCRRQHRCSDARLVCRATRDRLSPRVEATPEQRGRAQREIKQALRQEMAKRAALGETDSLEQRIAQLAARKLVSLRAAQSRGR